MITVIQKVKYWKYFGVPQGSLLGPTSILKSDLKVSRRIQYPNALTLLQFFDK